MSHVRVCVRQLSCVVFLFASVVHAEIVELTPSKDNSLFQTEPEDPPLSSGVGDSVFSGRTRESFQAKPDLRRALIAFDFSGIPSGSTINDVTLTLHVTKVRTIEDTDTTLHRVLTDWGEGQSNSQILGGGMGTAAEPGDATWFHSFFPDQFWTTPGGDFDPTPSATLPVGGTGAYAWNSPDMVTDVQNWVAGTADNFGWMVLVNQEVLGNAKRFGSRENLTAEFVPTLTVDFDPAEIATVDATKDNSLFEIADGSRSSGIGQSIYVGRNNRPTESRRRGAVAFDLSSIPSGSTVLAATVTLTAAADRLDSFPVTVHRFTADWGEADSNSDNTGGEGGGGQGAPSQSGDVTWLHTFFDTGLWTSPGGDFETTASASLPVGGLGPASWSSGAIAADVQHWLDTPSENFGWIFICDETSGGTATRFHSRESAAVQSRPSLSITFVPPPPGQAFIRGDVTTEGGLDISDAIALLEFLILGRGLLTCDDSADATDDGTVDLTDAIEILKFLILGDPPMLPAPTQCDGTGDPTADDLDCGLYEGCPP